MLNFSLFSSIVISYNLTYIQYSIIRLLKKLLEFYDVTEFEQLVLLINQNVSTAINVLSVIRNGDSPLVRVVN